MNKKEVSDSKQTFWLAFGKMLSLLATLIVPLFLTRFLSKDEYGFYTQFNTILFFLSSFFSFGMSTNIFYFFPTVDRDKIKSLLIQTLIFLLSFGLLSGLFIFIPVFSDFFLANDELQNYRVVIYILTLIVTLTTIIHPLYVVSKDVGVSVWFPTFQVVIKALAIVTFFLITPSIDSVINAIVVSSVLVLIVVFFYINKLIRKFPKGAVINQKLMKEQFNYNFPFGLSQLLKTFSEKFDKIICITYLSASAYASYSIAFFGIPGIQQIYTSISQVTIVNMVSCFNVGDYKKAHTLYKNMVVKTLSFSVPVILVVCLNAELIITFLFTGTYADATLLFQMFLISFVFHMLGAGLILRASGHTKFIIRAFLFASFISIPATYFLIKNYGSIGAMTGVLISIILPKIYQIKKEIEITRSSFRMFLPWQNMGKIFLVSLLALIPFVLLKFYLENYNILIVIFTSVTYISVVSIIEIQLKIFIVDKTKVLEILNGLKNKIKK